MDDKKPAKSSDDKKSVEQKNDGQEIQNKRRVIPDVEKSDRTILPEMRIDFDTDRTLADE